MKLAKPSSSGNRRGSEIYRSPESIAQKRAHRQWRWRNDAAFREKQKLNQKLRREKIKKDTTRMEKFRADVSARAKEYGKNPKVRLARIARSVVQRAVLSGKLVRKSCVKCYKKDAHAHHHDYSKPLDVMWLCHDCHIQEHIRMRRVAEGNKFTVRASKLATLPPCKCGKRFA